VTEWKAWVYIIQALKFRIKILSLRLWQIQTVAR